MEGFNGTISVKFSMKGRGRPRYTVAEKYCGKKVQPPE